MKNKEIEELLKGMRDVAKKNTIEVREYGVVETIPSSINKELRLNSYSANLLLSYIEQLENNRDKAIEEIKYLISNCDIVDYQGEKIMNILKGDSDE